MSDGMTDSRALDDIAANVSEAAGDLAAALKRARQGHRGLTVVNLVGMVNYELKGTGFELIERPDQRT